MRIQFNLFHSVFQKNKFTTMKDKKAVAKWMNFQSL